MAKRKIAAEAQLGPDDVPNKVLDDVLNEVPDEEDPSSLPPVVLAKRRIALLGGPLPSGLPEEVMEERSSDGIEEVFVDDIEVTPSRSSLDLEQDDSSTPNLVAQLVDEDQERMRIEAEVRNNMVVSSDAVQVDVVQEKRRKLLSISAIILVVVVIIAVSVSLAGSNNSSNKDSPVDSPTMAPTAAPLRGPDEIINFLNAVTLSNVTVSYPAVENSTEQQAALWLIEDDPLQFNVTPARLVQRYALAVLWYATTGPGWLLVEEPWLAAEPHECNWAGVACNREGMVLSLNLRGSNLQGTIPSDLSLLTSLENLDLSRNSLVGSIPLFEHRMMELQTFEFYSNILTGTLPKNLGNLWRQLVQFVGFDNELEGSIPSSLGLWRSLTRFDTENNNLSGSIPSEIGEWLNLESFHAGKNSLSGSIPSEIGQCTDLWYLNIEDNSVNGTIPMELGKLPLLELYLNGNKLTGSLPWDSLSGLSKLEKFFVQSNELTGTISSIIGEAWMTLTEIRFDSNKLTGSVPWDSLTGLSELKRLSVYSNQLTGTISSNVGQAWPALVLIWLDDNKFKGTLPRSLGNWTNLEVVELSRNYWSGTIPDEFNSWSKITYAQFHSTNLTGTMPLCDLPNQESIDISADCDEVNCTCCDFCCPYLGEDPDGESPCVP